MSSKRQRPANENVKQVKQARRKNDMPTWERQFPVNGQGTLVFNKDTEVPFIISVENEKGHYGLSIHIEKDHAMFFQRKGEERKKLSLIHEKECGIEKGKISYWYSYDRDNLVLKYGKGYRMEETTILTHDFLKNAASKEEKKEIRKELYPYFNAAEKKFIRKYEAMSVNSKGVTVTEEMVEFDKNPLISNVSPLVLDSSKVNLFFLDGSDYIFSASLPPACRELYENIKGCQLNYPEEVTGVLLSDAIRYSIETKNCLLNKRLKDKADEFGGNDIKETYLRVTLGQSLGKSPGIPYVLEIWPKGHYSPIHNHGNANAVIRVLYGSIHIMNYNKHVSSPHAKPMKEFDAREGDVTWINRNWYQTHKLKNTSNDYCATIQCYNYDAGDTTHWPYFDYISENSTIEEFFPNSDFTFREMREQVLKEYKQSLE
ncbi:Hypothetical predicted protein [Mytilus galloprovincialis]|uniref:Cysteine dioxygenase n=1 Tax=Mytilus galloprovincialis TaxID=29158 RepID=A0A8B6HPZ2_MYTGA|nr:Hypothetical predicted protein [Mytilus galloprovincialis]